MTRYLSRSGAFANDPFSLLDIGARGGIDDRWRLFGESLQAVGFDPSFTEVERLNAMEPNPRVRYIAAYVGHRRMQGEGDDGTFSSDPISRTSSTHAFELQNRDSPRGAIVQSHEQTPAADLIEIDEFIRQNPCNVDFLKVDTDGSDFAVLRGARELLSGSGVMALAIEAPLVGCVCPDGNLFSNIDAYLQEMGYSVFSMEPRFYSRAALPKLFRWNQPADTHAGQCRWADTLFCRDVCIPGYEERFRLKLVPHMLLKLCCIFELFGLEDCAAEILVTFCDRIRHVVDVEHCLDLLTPALPDGRAVSYREYIDYFENNVEHFYSGAGDLKRQIAVLQRELAFAEIARVQAERHARAQLERAELECAQLRSSIERSLALKIARSVRWLGPLRSLFLSRGKHDI